MEYLGWLRQAVNAATRAASVARLPSVMRGIPDAVAHADLAVVLVRKVASAMSSSAPLVSGPDAQLVRRSVGLIKLASLDMSKASASTLAASGQKLQQANGVLSQALGSALGRVDHRLLAQTARSALSLSGRSLSTQAASHPFLLEISSAVSGKVFRFALGKAAFDELTRSAKYNTPTQDRLTREPAVQATGKGGETLSVSGAIYLAAHGAGHLDNLRAMASGLAPVTLVTGYGQSLGRWYISGIDETQSHLFRDGAPRKQTFSLEFTKYGDDYQDA